MTLRSFEPARVFAQNPFQRSHSIFFNRADLKLAIFYHVILLAWPRSLIGGSQNANHVQLRHHDFLKEVLFMGQRYRRKDDQKLGPGLARNQDFAK